MMALALQAGLPWTTSFEEDRRFRRILLQALLLSLVVGVITPYIRMPPPVPDAADDLPQRRVRLLAEQLMPVPPAPVPTVPVVVAAPIPIPKPVPPPVITPKPPVAPKKQASAPVVTARQKAASTGVLAMSDALARLRGTTPRTGALSTPAEPVSEDRTATPQPSMLTENVTRGSAGVDDGVAHQSVLGVSELPDRVESGQGISGNIRTVPARGRESAPDPGKVRSEQQIQEVLDRHKGAMYTLYNRELRKDGSLQGKLVMSITIAAAGNVTRCVILDSELASASLEQQLVSLVKRIDFGRRPDVPAVTTKIPIEFFPR
jgi:protein TonB